jgi:hypothetical protein
MYTAVVCLVLFDARGDDALLSTAVPIVAAALAVAMLAVRYMPLIFHRPQLVDHFCEDVLAISAHASCLSVLQSAELQYACALHSACYIMQHRFLDKQSVPAALVHTVTGALLLAAYLHCPRISDIKSFITAVASPHLVELFAKAMSYLHRLLVVWLTEI